MAVKRIRGNGSFFRIRQRTTKYGRKGQIMGLWKRKA